MIGRQAILALAAGCLVALGAPATSTANWNQPSGGSLNFTPSQSACCPSIANMGGVPWVAWSENNGTAQQLVVGRLNGGTWSPVGGSLNVDSAQNAAGVIANVGGVPYVVSNEADSGVSQIFVHRFEAPNWVAVGSGSLNISATHYADFPSIASIAGVPYVAWAEQNSSGVYLLHVKRLDGSSWVTVGSTLNESTSQDAFGQTMADVGGVPYVTWSESNGTADQIHVKRFNGSDWVNVGSGSLNVSAGRDAFNASIAAVGGVPYVAWAETDGTNNQIRVKRFDGSNWVSVGGSLNFDTADSANGPDMASVGGAPFVGWQETAGVGSPSQVRVRRFDGSSWRLVGGGSLNVDPTHDAYFHDPVIVDIGGVPYACWEESDGAPMPIFQVRVKRLEPDVLAESAAPTVTGVTLTAQVNDFGVPLPVGFELGQTAGFGAQTPLQNTSGSGASTVSATVGGLSPATAYLYRAFGSDGFRETSQGATQSFSTLAAPPPAAPAISSAKLSRTAFPAAGSGASLSARRAKRKTGTDVRYRDSQAAKTTFRVLKRVPGHRKGARCRPGRPTKRQHRCTALRSLGSFSHIDSAGQVKVHFSGRVRGRKLRPARYLLTLTPTAGGNKGRTVTLPFRIVP